MSWNDTKAGLLKRTCPICGSPNRDSPYYVLLAGIIKPAEDALTTDNSSLCRHKWHSYVPHKDGTVSPDLGKESEQLPSILDPPIKSVEYSHLYERVRLLEEAVEYLKEKLYG